MATRRRTSPSSSALMAALATACLFAVLLLSVTFTSDLASGSNDPAAAAATVAAAAAHGARALLVSVSSKKGQQSIGFDTSLQLGAPDLPITDKRVAKLAPGCEAPEQVHVTLWSATSVLVSWATCDAAVSKPGGQPPAPAYAAADAGGSDVRWGTEKGKYTNTAKGVSTSYRVDQSAAAVKYNMPNATSYTSPLLHHALLKGLTPGKQYHYAIAGGGKAARTREFSFTMPRAGFPFTVGVFGDPGQTTNTTAVLDKLLAQNPDLLLLVGDFTYADMFVSLTQGVPDDLYLKLNFQPKWDTFGRLVEPLLSRVPLVHLNGNHETEPSVEDAAAKDAAKGRFVAYNARFPVPQTKDARDNGPTSFGRATEAEPFRNSYYAVEVPGVATFVQLTSYAVNQQFAASEEQYVWLERTLAAVDRNKTPWLIVNFHAPWYSSYKGHYSENECMRALYEPLLLKYKTDLTFSGHIHAYERRLPMAAWQTNDCGPASLTVGDGGNVEGIYKDFLDQLSPPPKFCSDLKAAASKVWPVYQPQQCAAFPFAGKFCPSSQPAWSAYREPSFGFGELTLLNATHARWQWWRSNAATGSNYVADEATIVRGASPNCAPSLTATVSAAPRFT